MKKYLVLDMDGTIADFYGVDGWQHYLDDLQDETPYRIAQPIYNPNILNSVLLKLKSKGWTIIINSWLSKTKTEDFHQRIRQAKLDWLSNVKLPYDSVIFLDYGTDKQESILNLGGVQVLVDDNDDIRASWNGITIDAKENIIPKLEALDSIFVYDKVSL